MLSGGEHSTAPQTWVIPRLRFCWRLWGLKINFRCNFKFVRAIIERTRACNKRLARLISNIHHTREFKQYCHVGKTAQHCRLGLFQDSDFAGDFEVSKSTSGGVLCIFWKYNFCSCHLDVQETNFSFKQFHSVWGRFSRCWIACGWVICSWSLGHSDWSTTFTHRQCPT